MRLAALLLLIAPLAPAQSPRPEDLGTVTGHVICGDNQRPARLAEVTLVPVSKPTFWHDATPVKTDLSGGYTMHQVEPGLYYVRVDLDGYVTPILSFDIHQLAKPSPALKQRIDRELQVISVTPNSTVKADVTLLRAASISGTVLYDDGAPAIGLEVELFRAGPNGRLTRVPNAGLLGTDAHGRFRFDALPTGEYTVDAVLNVYKRSNLLLRIYPPNAVRRNKAVPVKLESGEDASGIDITIPISTFHEVSGSLVTSDGHMINAGTVRLLFADDRSDFAAAEINYNDSTFDFPYVPEGNYILSVQEASDVGPPIRVASPPGVTPRTYISHRTLHTYSTPQQPPIEQPLAVQTDVQSLTLTVPDRPSTSTSE